MPNVRLFRRESVWPPGSCEAIKTKTESGKCFCIRVVLSIKLKLIVTSTNLEHRENERQRKRESRATGRRSKRKRARARDKTSLNSSSDNNTKLLTANKLFIEKSLEILKSYRAGMLEFYESEITSVDYKQRTEEVRQEINKWVEQKTNDKIKGLIPPGMLSSDTRLVLVNAIYFKGLWLQPFLKEETFPGTFFVAANQKVQVQMMRQEAHFKFFESEELGCQILEMPYIGSKMSMVIFLPVETDGLVSLEGKITYDNFEKSLSTLDSSRPEEMEVFLPKFKLTQQFSLNDVLSKMGASEMFIAGKADFSGITADSLYVSQVVHKAFIEVNEEGTEAAAATGIGVNALSLKPMFNADHPFLFFIRHNDAGAILFMGRLLKPSED